MFIFITFVIFKYYKTWEHTLPEFSLFEWESPIEATENIILFPVGFASSAVLFQSRECRWETNKVFFMTIRKKYVVFRDLLLEKRTKKKKKTTTATISVGCVKPFLFFRFPSVFLRCCTMQYCAEFAYSLAQIWLKWRSSGLIKRYILRQWIKRRGTMKLNQSVLHDVDL